MHVKTWICDETTILTGSVNMTHNGMENNAEQLWRIQSQGASGSTRADFERLWLKGVEVTSAHIDQMNAAHLAYYGPPRARSAQPTNVRRRLARAFGRAEKAEPELSAELNEC